MGARVLDGPAGASSPVLRVQDLHKIYGGVAALGGVNLEVSPGDVCGLIGPNGAGKTTLFDVISGITSPTSGRVFLDGRDVTGWPPERLARAGVRRTFQRPQLFGWLSVEDNVMVATEWRGGGGGLAADLLGLPSRTRREAARREQARQVLAACGLSKFAQRPAGSLPVAQARMVELARAVVEPPRVLLLDEPNSGLSPAEAELLSAEIIRVSAQGAAVVLVEHDMGFVMERCSRVVALDYGVVLAEGSPAEVQAHPDVRAAYLG